MNVWRKKLVMGCKKLGESLGILKDKLVYGSEIIFHRTKYSLVNTRGISTIEVILIIVVLVALVLLFKNQINEIVTTALNKVSSKADSL